MKRSIRTSTVAVGLAALILAGTSAAYASHTKVSVAGSTAVGDVAYTASAFSAGISFATNYGVEIDCSTASAGGTGTVIKRGATAAVPNTVATIGTLAFTGCTMAGFGFTATMTGGNINVRTHPTNAGDPLPVTIAGISMTISATSGGTCLINASGSLDGVIRTRSGTDGVLELVPASFGPPESGFGLTINNVVGCMGEFVNGDLLGAWYTDSIETLPSILAIDTTGAVTHS